MAKSLHGTQTRLLAIGIVDPLPLFRAGVQGLLRSSTITLKKCIEGNSGGDALRMVKDGSIDLLLLNPNIPNGGGEIIVQIQSMRTLVRTVILSNSENLENVAGALRLGVSGYIQRNVDGPELIRALQTIAGGGVYLTPSLGARLVAHPSPASETPGSTSKLDILTSRERQILSELSSGATNKEIGRRLNISESTVKFFMTSILQKTQSRNRLEAALSANEKKPLEGRSAPGPLGDVESEFNGTH